MERKPSLLDIRRNISSIRQKLGPEKETGIELSQNIKYDVIRTARQLLDTTGFDHFPVVADGSNFVPFLLIGENKRFDTVIRLPEEKPIRNSVRFFPSFDGKYPYDIQSDINWDQMDFLWKSFDDQYAKSQQHRLSKALIAPCMSGEFSLIYRGGVEIFKNNEQQVKQTLLRNVVRLEQWAIRRNLALPAYFGTLIISSSRPYERLVFCETERVAERRGVDLKGVKFQSVSLTTS